VQSVVRVLREETLPAEQARLDAEWERLAAQDATLWDAASAWERESLFRDAQQRLG